MAGTFWTILHLIERGEVNISDQGYDELAADDIFVRDVLATVAEGKVVEEYPEYPKGPCALILQRDAQGQPIHVVRGMPAGRTSPAVLVTAYRPNPERWSADFLRRRR